MAICQLVRYFLDQIFFVHIFLKKFQIFSTKIFKIFSYKDFQNIFFKNSYLFLPDTFYDLDIFETSNLYYLILWKNFAKYKFKDLSTNCQPIVNQLSTNCPPIVNQLSTNCQPIVNQLLSYSQLNVSQLSNNCQPIVQFLTKQLNLKILQNLEANS